MEILTLRNVSFSSESNNIIKSVNLDIEEEKTTAFVGPSGCGKSTLLKLIAGLILPTAGEVYYRGKNIAAMSRIQNLEFRRESAFVFQDSALWANQDLQQCLELPLRIHFPEMSVHEREQRVKEVVTAVGYKRSLDIRPSSLSMGEQKLIAFARAMICRPTLLFLDEFAESLDDNATNRLISLVKERKVNNNTIIIVSHDMRIIRNLADYVYMLMEGNIYTKMTPEQITNDREILELLEKGPS